MMDGILDNLPKTEFISICVTDPKIHKDDLWRTHIDYEICLHTNSMCFRRKTSCVRRRYSEFVWLRQCLERNALIIDLPKLPPWNPFFSLKNKVHINQRMKALEEFLENSDNSHVRLKSKWVNTEMIMTSSSSPSSGNGSISTLPMLQQSPVSLTLEIWMKYSRLHLFLQSNLSTAKIEKCVIGKTRYTVAEAIQRSSSGCISSFEDKTFCDSDCESSSSSGMGLSIDTPVRESPVPFLHSSEIQ